MKKTIAGFVIISMLFCTLPAQAGLFRTAAKTAQLVQKGAKSKRSLIFMSKSQKKSIEKIFTTETPEYKMQHTRMKFDYILPKEPKKSFWQKIKLWVSRIW